MAEATKEAMEAATIGVAAKVIIGAAVEAKIEVAVETKAGVKVKHLNHPSCLTTSTML
jgi:pyridoxal biosynthesis lyase PdxS